MTTQSAILDNPKWQTNQISSTAVGDYRFLWFFAIIWNAAIIFAVVMGGANILKTFEEQPIFYLFTSFPLIGIFLFYRAIKTTLAWRHFGKTPIVLDTFPGQIGGLVSGYLDIPVDYNSSHQVKISLNCIRHYISHSNGETEKDTDVKWQDIITVRSKATINGSRVHFSFKPPIGLPESTPKGSESIEWNIHIHLAESKKASQNIRHKNNRARNNKEFSRKFIIPVLKTTEAIRLKTQAISISENTHRKSNNIIPPETDIPQISSSINGTQYYYPAYRNKVMGIVMGVFGVALIGFTWMILQNVADFAPVTSSIFAGILALISIPLIVLSLYMIFNSLSIEVNPQGVKTQQKILSFSFNSETKVADIADIIIKKGMTSTDGNTSHVWYGISMILKNGSDVAIGDNLEGSSYAESIRQKMISNLGSWTAKEYPKNIPDNKLAQIKDKLDKNKKLSIPIKILQKTVPLIIPLALLYDARELIFSIASKLL